ncbi:MAG: copper chaperone PCu(A)C [Verrucomicrobia bacterium]|nr:copper chaperone PCu(A)C [Verrucomicrobiota bacterium]
MGILPVGGVAAPTIQAGSLCYSAGATLELKPGGDHLMIMGLISHPIEGEHVKLTVRFAPGDQQLDLEVPVLRQEPK